MDRHESIRSFLGRYGLSAEEYYPSSRLSAFRAGGTLEWYVLPDSAESAEALLSFARREELHLKAIGRGSNLIFSDRLHEGIFVGTKMMSDFLILPGRVECSCGVFLPSLCRTLAARGFSLAEELSGIPASIGGAVRQNAGAFGKEIADILLSATVYDRKTGEKTIYTPEQMNFRYRGSLLSGTDDFLLSAAFRTAGCDPVEIRDRMAAFAVRRRAAQPLDLPSLGSFFKRPPDRSAAALIDECGLKGLTIGGAAVSGKHAGFLVNRGGATAADLIALAALVRERVFDRFHVLLEPEAEIVP